MFSATTSTGTEFTLRQTWRQSFRLPAIRITRHPEPFFADIVADPRQQKESRFSRAGTSR